MSETEIQSHFNGSIVGRSDPIKGLFENFRK